MLKGEIDADACVIGLGGSGLAAIEALLEDGKTVVGIDAKEIAGSAAGSNGGLLLGGLYEFYHEIVRRFGRDRAREMYGVTLEQLERMQRETHDSVINTGSLRLGDDEEFPDCIAHMNALRADGFAAEPYEGREGCGLWIPQDAIYHPRASCRASAERILSDRALLFEHTKAVKIETGRVQTTEGTVHCKEVIIAVDGGIERFLPPHLRAGIQTYRLQMLGTAKEQPNLFPTPIYFRKGFDYVQQLQDGRIALGGGRDKDSRSTVASTYHQPSDEVQKFLETTLRNMGVSAPVTHRWAAPVAFTDSGLPIAEEIAENVIAVGAYSGTGNLVGRILGRAVARRDRKTIELFTKRV